MPLKSRIIAFICIVVPILVVDQVSKVVARDTLMGGRVFSFFNGFLTLQYAENPGAFLGWGSTLPPVWRTIAFSVLPFLLLAILAVSILRSPDGNRATVAGAAMVFGGGLGNLVDRLVFNGMVTDFAMLQLGPLRTGIFNVADMAITGGVILLILHQLFAGHPERKQPVTEPEQVSGASQDLPNT